MNEREFVDAYVVYTLVYIENFGPSERKPAKSRKYQKPSRKKLYKTLDLLPSASFSVLSALAKLYKSLSFYFFLLFSSLSALDLTALKAINAVLPTVLLKTPLGIFPPKSTRMTHVTSVPLSTSLSSMTMF